MKMTGESKYQNLEFGAICDRTLVLPPRIAPQHIVILPIYRKEEDRENILNYCKDLAKDLRALYYEHSPVMVHIDDRDIRGGEKVWGNIKKGVPIRLEVGPKDMEKNSVFMGRRDKAPKDKQSIPRDEFVESAVSILSDMQAGLLAKAKKFRKEHTKEINTFDELVEYFKKDSGGFAVVPWTQNDKMVEMLKPHKLSARCIPLEQSGKKGVCIFSGEETTTHIIVAQSY
jgi:prolyl-tRNA synthetase